MEATSAVERIVEPVVPEVKAPSGAGLVVAWVCTVIIAVLGADVAATYHSIYLTPAVAVVAGAAFGFVVSQTMKWWRIRRFLREKQY